MINKQQLEAQLQQIFRLLLEKTQEQIVHELNISTRTVARYCKHIEKRYGEMQRQKTDNTLFTECQLFKNRMLTLYKTLETKAFDYKMPGVEKAKCAEVAANRAIDVLKMESEGIKAVKEGLSALTNKKNNNTNLYNNNNHHHNYNHQLEEEENDNRKF
jgi:hypothetical protein